MFVFPMKEILRKTRSKNKSYDPSKIARFAQKNGVEIAPKIVFFDVFPFYSDCADLAKIWKRTSLVPDVLHTVKVSSE